MDTQKYKKIANYITLHPLAVIGTIDGDGTPYGSVVFVCSDDRLPCVYFMTKNSTRKYKNLIARPEVSLTISDFQNNSTLQAKGHAIIVNDAATLDMIATKINRIFTTTHEWLPPITKLRAGAYAMVAVELSEARLAEYSGKQIGEAGIFTDASIK